MNDFACSDMFLGACHDFAEALNTGRRRPSRKPSHQLDPWRSYDNAMAEALNSVYKAGLIDRREWSGQVEVMAETSR